MVFLIIMTIIGCASIVGLIAYVIMRYINEKYYEHYLEGYTQAKKEMEHRQSALDMIRECEK